MTGGHRGVQVARKVFRRFPPLRTAVHNIDLLRKYGRLKPERMTLHGSGNAIFVNPSEPRGRALLRNFGTGQPGTKTLWRRALVSMQPNVVLDVGANYGEFLFLATYEEGTRVVGIEADPELYAYLVRSRAVHPNQQQIELHCALAGAEDGRETPFFVDTAWSGRSSALAHDTIIGAKTVMVSSVTVDSILAVMSGEPLRLLFKVDVEGYEPEVLRGMSTTLNKATCLFGIIECNEQLFRKLGVSLGAFVDILSKAGTVHVAGTDGELWPIECAFNESGSSPGFNGDLVVVRG